MSCSRPLAGMARAGDRDMEPREDLQTLGGLDDLG